MEIYCLMPYGIICVPSIAGFCIKYTAARNYANVQSTLNPADIASRGIGVKQRKEWELWSTGPSFLRQPKEEWKVGLEFSNQKWYN